jgi:hypothetical protein
MNFMNRLAPRLAPRARAPMAASRRAMSEKM